MTSNLDFLLLNSLKGGIEAFRPKIFKNTYSTKEFYANHFFDVPTFSIDWDFIKELDHTTIKIGLHPLRTKEFFYHFQTKEKNILSFFAEEDTTLERNRNGDWTSLYITNQVRDLTDLLENKDNIRDWVINIIVKLYDLCRKIHNRVLFGTDEPPEIEIPELTITIIEKIMKKALGWLTEKFKEERF